MFDICLVRYTCHPSAIQCSGTSVVQASDGRTGWLSGYRVIYNRGLTDGAFACSGRAPGVRRRLQRLIAEL